MQYTTFITLLQAQQKGQDHEEKGNASQKGQNRLYTDGKQRKENQRNTENITRRDTTMITRMYTIRDIIANNYTIPMAYPNDATAKRHFEIMKEDDKSIMGARPQDYEMYFCGEYNMETGKFEAKYPLIRIDTLKGGTDV